MTECHTGLKRGWRCKNSLSLQRSRRQTSNTAKIPATPDGASLMHPTPAINLTACHFVDLCLHCLPTTISLAYLLGIVPNALSQAHDVGSLQGTRELIEYPMSGLHYSSEALYSIDDADLA